MQAFEFKTTSQNGTIQIPDDFISKITKNIKVIILTDENEKAAGKPFPYFGVSTAGYVFNREEANER